MLKILPWLPSSLGVKANVLGLPPHPVTSAPTSPAGSRGSHAASVVSQKFLAAPASDRMLAAQASATTAPLSRTFFPRSHSPGPLPPLGLDSDVPCSASPS